jgi:hypothetical protein
MASMSRGNGTFGDYIVSPLRTTSPDPDDRVSAYPYVVIFDDPTIVSVVAEWYILRVREGDSWMRHISGNEMYCRDVSDADNRRRFRIRLSPTNRTTITILAAFQMLYRTRQGRNR